MEAETRQAVSQAQLNSAHTAKIVDELPSLQEANVRREREVGQQNRYPKWLNRLGQAYRDYSDTILHPVKGLFGIGASTKW